MKFLVIRFRQMGDAILSTSLLNAIKNNFPDSETHFVLNDNIAPLFEGHPAINRLITFSKEERHSPLKYLKKIFRIMRSEKYDVIIDMRSTLNTLPFTMFAPSCRFRIGIDKKYTLPFFNYRFNECISGNMCVHDVNLLSPLSKIKQLDLNVRMSLAVTNEELDAYRKYLTESGIDFNRPVLLCGVVTKDDDKEWAADRMCESLTKIMEDFPTAQLIFNYAPGHEEKKALTMYETLGKPDNIFFHVKAKSMRELMCLATFSDAYFGNEGGARHIVESMGTPSFVIGSPTIPKGLWVKESETAVCLTVSDIDSGHNPHECDITDAYQKITVSEVYSRLKPFLNKFMQHQ
ncbi:MAG: glycosyltransferase family 9 protein [Candidatus Amulumruptor caecigallinarius]|nr:glycosyltransferase family 9 protein [Candidatus Amulumruptor caecigallinarius]